MKIKDILAFLEGESLDFRFFGDQEGDVEGFSSLSRYKAGTFTWIKGPENIPENFDLSSITLAFAAQDVQGPFLSCIQTSQSKRAFFSVMEHFYFKEEDRPPVGQFTYISPKVKLGKNVRIGHNCVLDGDITIGDGTVIWNNVTILNRVVIGKNCDIHSGTVIGHDGSAYTEDEGHRKTMVRHFGGVTIGDGVSIFENVCIARGTIDDTEIEDGCLIDSLSHISHNVRIKKNSALAAPCRLNGSVTVGENVYMAGVTVKNQCVVGDGSFLGLGTIIIKDVPPGMLVADKHHKVVIERDRVRDFT